MARAVRVQHGNGLGRHFCNGIIRFYQGRGRLFIISMVSQGLLDLVWVGSYSVLEVFGCWVRAG